MIKYHLLLFVRKIQRQKLLAFINILGLSVGMASALIVYLFASYEFSYDRFHANADRIYRVNQTFIWGEGNKTQFSSTGPGVSFALEAEIPEIEQVVRIHTPGDFLISYTNEKKEIISIDQQKIFCRRLQSIPGLHVPDDQRESENRAPKSTNIGDDRVNRKEIFWRRRSAR